MKYLSLFYIISIILAFVGILSQNGEANAITYTSVALLVLCGLYHLSLVFKK